MSGAPDLALLRDTIRLLRSLRAEETIPVPWFGGLRSGSDLAKALGCDGGILLAGTKRIA